MHVQPISTFRLFQEGHLLRNSIAIFVLTTLFYFIGAELRLVHELSLFWPLNGVMAGVFARYVWLNRLHYYAISYVAMLVYDAITTEWGLVSLAINFSNMMFIVTVALLVARDKRLGKNKYEPVSALRLFNYCLLAALLCAIVGAIGSVSIDSLDFWPLLADWFSEQFSTGVLIVPCMLTLAIPGVLPRFKAEQMMPAIALIVSVIASVVIGGAGSLAFPLPALIWCAVRYTPQVTCLLTFVTGAVEVVLVANSVIDISVGSPFSIPQMFSARLGIATMAICPIMVSFSVAAINSLMKQVALRADFDFLTQVYSRSGLYEALKSPSLKQTQHLTVMLLDIDYFKSINDNYGHECGDKVLSVFAQHIQKIVGDKGLVARMGGEEFAVAVPSVNPVDGLNEKGEAVSDARLIRSVNREISVYSEYDEFLKLAHNPEMRFVFSNTTEAGISYHAGDKFDDAPAVSYPAKLTRLLFERFSHFNGALDKGWIIIPCELIDYNGDALRELVLRYAQEWALPEAFIQWLDQANSFCSTLVDRIVTGYPRDEVAKLEEELGYHDGFLDTAEHFYLFVIQGPKSLATELRLDKYPLNVLIVDDIKPYKERKVAILNGAHTALVPVAFQAGLDTVGEAMNDAEICAFVEKAIYEEIIPVLDLPRDELESFASAVTGRFRNPYIKHQLLSIALNGMTKFRTRILPQLLAGQKANGTLPARLTFALAALIAFYRGERNGETYPVQDDAHWLERYQQLWSQYRDRVIGTQELVAIVLAEKDHWEQDLTQVPGLVEQVANDLDAILEKGMREAVRPLC